MIILRTASEVIDLLGGNKSVASLVGATTAAVSQWRRRGLPSYTFIALQALLIEKGASAPASLWRMQEIKQSIAVLQQ